MNHDYRLEGSLSPYIQSFALWGGSQVPENHGIRGNEASGWAKRNCKDRNPPFFLAYPIVRTSKLHVCTSARTRRPLGKARLVGHVNSSSIVHKNNHRGDAMLHTTQWCHTYGALFNLLFVLTFVFARDTLDARALTGCCFFFTGLRPIFFFTWRPCNGRQQRPS